MAALYVGHRSSSPMGALPAVRLYLDDTSGEKNLVIWERGQGRGGDGGGRGVGEEWRKKRKGKNETKERETLMFYARYRSLLGFVSCCLYSLKSRGVDDKTKLPYFPYRDDGEVLFSAIEDMVEEYVQQWVFAYISSLRLMPGFVTTNENPLHSIYVTVITRQTRTFKETRKSKLSQTKYLHKGPVKMGDLERCAVIPIGPG